MGLSVRHLSAGLPQFESESCDLDGVGKCVSATSADGLPLALFDDWNNILLCHVLKYVCKQSFIYSMYTYIYKVVHAYICIRHVYILLRIPVSFEHICVYCCKSSWTKSVSWLMCMLIAVHFKSSLLIYFSFYCSCRRLISFKPYKTCVMWRGFWVPSH